MSEYNGWANYETWRVNLEMLDGMSCSDFGITPDADKARDELADALESYCKELADALESYCKELVEMDAKGFALDLALSYLNHVDWKEIAEHMLQDYAE